MQNVCNRWNYFDLLLKLLRKFCTDIPTSYRNIYIITQNPHSQIPPLLQAQAT